jgi:hypothetical protein
VNGIIIYSAGRLWARGAVGSASDWQSEGQGFESPRVHQSFEYRIDVTLASYRPSRLGLTHYLALPPQQPLAWFMSQGPVCTALRQHQIEPRALAASALLARGRARARQDMACHLPPAESGPVGPTVAVLARMAAGGQNWTEAMGYPDPRQAIVTQLAQPRRKPIWQSAPSAGGWRRAISRGGGHDADPDTMRFVKQRGIPGHELHAVAFADRNGRNYRYSDAGPTVRQIACNHLIGDPLINSQVKWQVLGDAGWPGRGCSIGVAPPP